MIAPPTFPRIPHLIPGRGTRDDLVLTDSERAAFLSRTFAVEEKLDGANVALWCEGGVVRCGLRSGPDSLDRAGQLGPLKAWAAEHTVPLLAALGGWDALYGEWLFFAHSVAYDALDSLLVVLDLWSERRGFASLDERDAACQKAGLAAPPLLGTGPRTVSQLEAMMAESRCGKAGMEGVVLRALDQKQPRLVKLLNPRFRRLSDAEWSHGRPRNSLRLTRHLQTM